MTQPPVSVGLVTSVQVALIPVGLMFAAGIEGADGYEGTLGAVRVNVDDQGLFPISFLA